MEWTGLNELREKYLSFFESKGHLRLPSFSLVPQGDKSLLLINAVCCEKMKRRSLPARCAIGSLIITVVEFLFGLLVNRVLHLHVWDYSALPLNIMGQICLPFSLIWFVLTIPASALCKLCCRLSAFPKETKSASVITDP